MFVSEQVLQGSEHKTHLLIVNKSYPLLQLKHFVSDPEHVLQFELHFAQVLLEVK